MAKAVKVKQHVAKKKAGGTKSVKAHTRRIKTAADNAGAGGELAAKGATPKKVKMKKGSTAAKSHMAKLRSMRKTKPAGSTATKS